MDTVKKIGITTVAFSRNSTLVEELKNAGLGEVKINPFGRRLTRVELIEFLSDCDAAIVGLDQIDAEVLKKLPKLGAIAKYGVGLDNLNLPDCKEHGVPVLYSKGVNKRSVAEMVLGFMLSLSRNLYMTSNQLKTGNWNKNGGFEISGKTIGVIGVGNIGKDVIRLLAPFNCRVLGNDIEPDEQFFADHGVEKTNKDIIFNQCDIISVHTPLTEQTESLFNQNTFGQMKKNAIVINTARGGIFDYEALKTALKTGEIAGAGIDVYDTEPPKDRELLEIPNLMNTPHIGGNSREAVMAMGRDSINNLLKYFV